MSHAVVPNAFHVLLYKVIVSQLGFLNTLPIHYLICDATGRATGRAIIEDTTHGDLQTNTTVGLGGSGIGPQAEQPHLHFPRFVTDLQLLLGPSFHVTDCHLRLQSFFEHHCHEHLPFATRNHNDHRQPCVKGPHDPFRHFGSVSLLRKRYES